MTDTLDLGNQLQLRSTKPIKLKDRPGRGGLMIDLQATFGFIPKRIIVQKVHGENNKIVVSAVKEAEATPTKEGDKNGEKKI
jgi:hypothetical protein